MRVHIIGAGLAGLAAAVRLVPSGAAITLYEAAPRAGGRCRSFHDARLGCVIDNGNHLIMSGNQAVMAYLDAVGARDRLSGPAAAAFPFIDVATGARWTLHPNRGRVPWWIFDARRRVPGTRAASYLSAACLLRARRGRTVADYLSPADTLYRTFWEPLTIAALNISPAEGAAALMAPVLRETFLKGADACRPLVARDSLAATLIDPALTLLEGRGAAVHFGCRVRTLMLDADAVRGFETDLGPVVLGARDVLILAVPPWIAGALVPDLAVPPPGEAIVNVHYRLPRPVAAPSDVRVIGIVGGLAQWVFARGDLASVTISAAGSVADDDADDIAARCWRDVALALDLGGTAAPPARVIKEKRATFAQTPAALALRPGAETRFGNLLLAGDWTATGLPATIEGAVRSGFKAADAAAKRLRAATHSTRAA